MSQVPPEPDFSRIVHANIPATLRDSYVVPGHRFEEMFRIYSCYKMGLLVWAHSVNAPAEPPDPAEGALDTPEEDELASQPPLTTIAGVAGVPLGYQKFVPQPEAGADDADQHTAPPPG